MKNKKTEQNKKIKKLADKLWWQWFETDGMSMTVMLVKAINMGIKIGKQKRGKV